MQKNQKINVYIEIEKHSNIKYEINKKTGKLEIDRILPYPYFYPYAYGFIPNTLAFDDDELDILIITEKELKNNNFYDIFIIGCLVMEDEKGLDEKILCVLEEDYDKIKDIDELEQEIKDNLQWFFSNYKNKSVGRWSKVLGFTNKDLSMELYKKYLKNFEENRIKMNISSSSC